MRLCIYKCYLTCTVILGSASGIFQTYLSIIQEHTHAYSESCVSLAYSEHQHIPITKHIQISRHIDNTILNIFCKAPSWTLDTVLHAPVSYRYYLTSRKTLRCL